MAFPATPLPVVVQWWINDEWTTIAANDVLGGDRADVTITAGRSDETRPVDPSTCTLTLRNTLGQFSPKNPSGAFYGLFGRNTALRVGVRDTETWLQVEGPDQGSAGATPAAGARVTAPDSAGLSVTGDIDLRFDADMTSWNGETVDLLGKWTATAGQKSYELVLQVDGRLGLYWSNDGTTEHGLISELPVPVTTGRLAVRATLDVNDGAGGHVATFYTSDSLAGSWTQLGDTRPGSGTTSIFNSTTVATVLDTQTGSQATVIRGRVYGAEIRNGIGGSAVGNPDFTAQSAGATSFADAAGNTWTLTGAIELTDLDIRFTGEVPEWPPRRDVTGADEWVTITANGAGRRLGQSDPTFASPLRRGVDRLTTAVAYWPCEDGSGATAFASGIPGGRSMPWTGTPNLGGSSESFRASANLPTVNGSIWYGPIGPHTVTGEYSFSFVLRLPAGTADLAVLGSLLCADSRWDLVYGTVGGGSVQLEAYDADGTFVDESAFITFGVDDENLWFQLDLTEDGADVDYSMRALFVGETTGLVASGTISGIGLGRAQSVRMNRLGASGLSSNFAVLGHVLVRNDLESVYTLSGELNGWDGETAGRRIERLCEETNTQFTGLGDLDDTAVMGLQGQASLLTLLREAADADQGVLYEPRDRSGLAYRSRASLYGQGPGVVLSYPGHELNAYEPTEDDTGLVNDVEVKRGGAGSPVAGSSSRQADTTGPLSTAFPPAGVGPGYAQQLEVNVATDAQLPDQAGWRLHLGTVDEQRVPGIVAMLQRTVFDDDDRRVVRALDIGDVLTVTDPPTSMGAPDDMRQLIQGWTERLHQFDHSITWRTSPASPYDVGEYDDDDSVYTSEGTTLTDAETTSSTTWRFTTPAGPLWSTDAADYPQDFIVAGERVTVSAVSGTTSPQTVTVSARSVNGVVKAHDAGETVELADVVFWGL